MEAVGRLAGGIAHDFNNLLMTVNGHADLLNEALPAGSPMLANVKGILASVDKAAALTRQLLSISRQQTISPRSLDLNAVIEGIRPGLAGLADEGVELTIDLDAAIAPVLADPNQMERVISILIANAREAMPKGGKLAISTRPPQWQGLEWRPASPDGGTPKASVMLSTSDSGTGMTDEVKARLFEPFFTTKPIGKGAGLGLSTVYGIVKSGGGEIQVQTAPGEGTVFRLYFPPQMHPAAVAPAAPPIPSESESGGETILLVEDDDEVRFLLYSILKADGYTVLEAHDGEQASGGGLQSILVPSTWC